MGFKFYLYSMVVFFNFGVQHTRMVYLYRVSELYSIVLKHKKIGNRLMLQWTRMFTV